LCKVLTCGEQAFDTYAPTHVIQHVYDKTMAHSGEDKKNLVGDLMALDVE
jgi:hypothetical protein